MLSATPEGKKWLSQFEANDREVAKLLLDSLIVVDTSAYEEGLSNALNFFSAKHREPIALYTAVERPKYIPPGGTLWKKTPDPAKPFFPPSKTVQNSNREPEIYARPKAIGSEGALAKFCRDYAACNKRILSHPGLEEIRTKKVRWIVVIDDIIGSGNRTKEFLEWLYGDRTVRSWYSSRMVRFAVIAYAATPGGESVVEGTGLCSELVQCQGLAKGRNIWTGDERKAIEILCRRYTTKFKLGHPLGYKSAFSTILFSHGMPNTNPSILKISKGSWKALVDKNSLHSAIVKKSIRDDQKEHVRLLKATGQARLAKSLSRRPFSINIRKMIVLLSCIASRRRKPEVISEMMELTLEGVKDLHARCVSAGWIDSQGRLTLYGRNALDAAKKHKIHSSVEMKLKTEYYFPTSLRSPASPSRTTP